MVRPIIEKDGRYFTGEAHYEGGKTLYRFSPSAFDAKRFKFSSDARRKAKAIGGRVLWFDILDGTTREDNEDE